MKCSLRNFCFQNARAFLRTESAHSLHFFFAAELKTHRVAGYFLRFRPTLYKNLKTNWSSRNVNICVRIWLTVSLSLSLSSRQIWLELFSRYGRDGACDRGDVKDVIEVSEDAVPEDPVRAEVGSKVCCSQIKSTLLSFFARWPTCAYSRQN